MAKLYFRYGAMNSGKTTALLQVAFNYNERGMRVLILKASVDTKGGDRIVSRLGVSHKVDVLVSPDMDILDIVRADMIHRRQNAVEDMIYAVIFAAALEREHIARLCHDADRTLVALWGRTDAARLLIREVLTDGAAVYILFRIHNGVCKLQRLLLREGQNMKCQPLCGFGSDSRKCRQFFNQFCNLMTVIIHIRTEVLHLMPL